jgi:hypothetical protein
MAQQTRTTVDTCFQVTVPQAPRPFRLHVPDALVRVRQAGCAVALSGVLMAFPPSGFAVDQPQVTYPSYAPTEQRAQLASEEENKAHVNGTNAVKNDTPIIDLAHVFPPAKLLSAQESLKALENETGWKVRVITRYGPEQGPGIEEIRSGWSVDGKTVVIFLDPSSPNILNFRFGPQVQKILPRPFFTELQSRYGNIYFVRENGEQAAIQGALEALTVCMRKGGCRVPPGLPQDQYFFTLGCAVAGGLVLGAALRLEPQGFVQRQWIYGLLFAPLWATLAINFGIGPIVSRTSDIGPVAINIAATVLAAALIKFYPQAARATGLTIDEPMNSDWE